MSELASEPVTRHRGHGDAVAVVRARPRVRVPVYPAEAGFPRGVGAPSAVQLVLLTMIAAFTALYLIPAGPQSWLGTADGNGTVPGEVLSSRQHATEAASDALTSALTATAADLRVAAASGVLDDPDPGAALDRLTATYPAWRGVLLAPAAGGPPIAARGAPVPAAGVGAGARAVFTGGTGVVVSTVPLGGARTGQVLAVSTALRPLGRVAAAGQSARLVADDGTQLTRSAADGPVVAGLVREAGTSAAGGRGGTLVGPRSGRLAPVVAYAPVAYAPVTDAESGGSLGMAVVTVRDEQVQGAAGATGLAVAAGTLLVLAALGFLVLRTALVWPIQRLRGGALGFVDGGVAARPSRVREVAPLAVRLGARPVRAWLPATAVLAVVTVAVLGWSAAVALTVGAQPVRPGPAVVGAQAARLAQSADRVRRSVSGGVVTLRSAAALLAGRPPDRVAAVLDALAGEHGRFRNVTVTGPGGGATGGDTALRTAAAPPRGEGVRQDTAHGPLPVVYAYTPIPGTRDELVGEYDVAKLGDLLETGTTRVRVVDARRRTVLDTQSYLAFEPLADPVLTRATAAAAPTAEVTGDTIVTARPLATGGRVAALHWSVVGQRPLDSLATRDNRTSAGARAAALLAALTAVGTGCWHAALVLRPLRRLREGNPSPRRQDEIGTLAACLHRAGRH